MLYPTILCTIFEKLECYLVECLCAKDNTLDKSLNAEEVVLSVSFCKTNTHTTQQVTLVFILLLAVFLVGHSLYIFELK